jgi:DNA-3-methyladenine glycosylase II
MTKILLDSHSFVLMTAKRKHPAIAGLLQRNGVITIQRPKGNSLFEFLARTVVGQQLSVKAARTIWGRLSQLGKSEDKTFTELFKDHYRSKISGCGVSQAKTKALLLLNEAFLKGQINEKRIREASYQDISKIITSLWGFGTWSADMVAIFYVQLPDVWPENDVALNRGLKILIQNGDPVLIAQHYCPKRTYLAMHIWKGLDSGTING